MAAVVVVIAGGLFALSVASGRPAIRLTIVAAITAPVGSWLAQYTAQGWLWACT